MAPSKDTGLGEEKVPEPVLGTLGRTPCPTPSKPGQAPGAETLPTHRPQKPGSQSCLGLQQAWELRGCPRFSISVNSPPVTAHLALTLEKEKLKGGATQWNEFIRARSWGNCLSFQVVPSSEPRGRALKETGAWRSKISEKGDGWAPAPGCGR